LADTARHRHGFHYNGSTDRLAVLRYHRSRSALSAERSGGTNRLADRTDSGVSVGEPRMRVYFDTGPLIDYLKFRTPYVDALRSLARHGRPQRQVSRDLEECLTGLARPSNSSITSALTFVELESALHEKMKRKSRGVISANKIPFFLLSSRALLESAMLACQVQGMKIIELRPEHVKMV